MQTETPQQKAMQDIFSLEEAVSQFESFGSQLDLGLPTVEDDAPKSFEDMLEVNPSDEPLEYGENFASEGDDLQDKQTQKFVVDEFAKKIAELPDGNISPEDITGISAVIQMNNHITGDVRSFIQQTIDHAVQAQQQQNVSDAQPNGTVSQDIAKTGDAGAASDLGAPAAMGDTSIPPMEPIDPTAEPSLDANTGDDMGLGLDANVGDPLAGMDDPLAEPTGDEGVAGTGEEDPLAGMGGEDDLGAGLDNLGGEDDGATTDDKVGANDDLDSFLDSEDEGEGEGSKAETDDKDLGEDKSTDTTEDNASKEDNDADFNFEAIATKARGLMEQNEGEAIPLDPNSPPIKTPESEELYDQGKVEGEKKAKETLDGAAKMEEELGDPDDDTITEVTDDSNLDPTSECAKTAARVESIVKSAKLKMAAEKARAVLESYHDRTERASTLAKLDGVVNNLKKSVLTESIIKKYAAESKRRAMVESVAAKKTKAPKATFESAMNKIDNVIKNASVKKQADKIIAEFEASVKNAKPVMESASKPKAEDKLSKKLNAIIEGVTAQVNTRKQFTNKLNGILEGVQKSQKASKAAKDLDQQLDDIVKQVKNA